MSEWHMDLVVAVLIAIEVGWIDTLWRFAERLV